MDRKNSRTLSAHRITERDLHKSRTPNINMLANIIFSKANTENIIFVFDLQNTNQENLPAP